MHDALMKTLIAIAFAIFSAQAQAQAAATFQDGVQPAMPPHPALYSFADIYRLTVGAAPPAVAGTSETAVRVAATPPAPSAEAQFRVRMPEPRGWMLLLAGLAAAGWVARRRLGYSL